MLTEWLVSRGWREFLNENGQKKIAGSFKRFADIQLSRAAAELKIPSCSRWATNMKVSFRGWRAKSTLFSC